MKKLICVFAALMMTAAPIYAAQNDTAIEHTKAAEAKINEFSNKLNEYTSDMIKSGKLNQEQAKRYDAQINEFEKQLKADKYAVYQFVHSGAEAEDGKFLNYAYEEVPIDIASWDKSLDIADEINNYSSALRRFRINEIMYLNGYRNLAAYLANYAKKPVGKYTMDGMVVKVLADDYVSIDLSKAGLVISKGDENSYGYGYVRVTAPNGNKYIFTGYAPEGNYDGYFVPTADGMILNCEYGGRKKFLLDTSKRTTLADNEAVMLSELFFDKYLKQSKVNYSYKGIGFTGNGKGVYTITIPNGAKKAVSNMADIHESYSESGSMDSGKWQCVTVGSNGYYWLCERQGKSFSQTIIDEYSNMTLRYNDMTINVRVK